MEKGLALALRFIRETRVYKYPAEYDEPGEERETIKPIPGAKTIMISEKMSDSTWITVYWDMSYGPVLVKDVAGEEPSVKRLPGVVLEEELTEFSKQGIAELGITHIQIMRHQLEFAKDKSGLARLIIIQTIEQGVDTTHGCKTWSTLIYNLDSKLLFEIGGAQEVRNIQGWMNWLLTPDGQWIILWQSDCFQPLFYRISDLEARLTKKNGYNLRVDRLDWFPKISPYSVSSIFYLPRITNLPNRETISIEAYRDYLQDAGELDADEALVDGGYLIVYVNDTNSNYGYHTMASDDFAGRLGTQTSYGHKSTNIPITDKGYFMIDLLRRRLMPRVN